MDKFKDISLSLLHFIKSLVPELDIGPKLSGVRVTFAPSLWQCSEPSLNAETFYDTSQLEYPFTGTKMKERGSSPGRAQTFYLRYHW